MGPKQVIVLAFTISKTKHIGNGFMQVRALIRKQTQLSKKVLQIGAAIRDSVKLQTV